MSTLIFGLASIIIFYYLMLFLLNILGELDNLSCFKEWQVVNNIDYYLYFSLLFDKSFFLLICLLKHKLFYCFTEFVFFYFEVFIASHPFLILNNGDLFGYIQFMLGLSSPYSSIALRLPMCSWFNNIFYWLKLSKLWSSFAFYFISDIESSFKLYNICILLLNFFENTGF